MIPYVIHQTWKSAAAMTPEMIQNAHSWRNMSPDYEYRFYSDKQCRQAVKSYRPDALAAYDSMKRPVERADLFRYVIVWAVGGIYSDIDTVCKKHPFKFVPANSRFVTGIEGSFPTLTDARRYGFVHKRQYCQWTFAAAPKHPILNYLIEKVKANSAAAVHSHSPFRWGHLETIWKTGPGAFTEAVDWGLAQRLPGIVVHDIAVFGAGQEHSGSPSVDDERVAVVHKFMYSWDPAASARRKKKAVIWMAITLGLVAIAGIVSAVIVCKGNSGQRRRLTT